MSRRFQKRKENFFCLHCGAEVKGDGFTNHCPHCLWSLHVDVNPGDRAENCQSLMRPIKAHISESDKYLIHRCESCSSEKKNRLHAEDSMEELLKLVQQGELQLI